MSLEVKGKILHNLKGCFVDMAKDKYAGHIVDKCWAVANIEQKVGASLFERLIQFILTSPSSSRYPQQSIATELLEGERELTTNYHGRHILRNCRIDQFKRQYDEWMAREVGIEKKRRLFEEFLDVSAVPAAVKPIKNVAPARAAAVAALRQTDKVDSSSDAKSAEIDLIFSSNGTFAPSVAPVRAVKYTATGSNATSVVKSTSKKAKKHDSDILDVLEAIDRSAGKKVKSKEAAKSIKEGALKKKEKSKKRTASESVSDMTSAKRKLSKKAKTEEQLKRRKFAS